MYNNKIKPLLSNIGYIIGAELSNELIYDNGIRKFFDIVYNLLGKINSKEYKTKDVMYDLTIKRKNL